MAQRWLRDYTATTCGAAFNLENVYLSDTPDFPPLVRYIGQFEEADAREDPLLAIARFVRFLPRLKNFLSNRCPRLLQEIGQLTRELRQEHRDRPLGPNPLEFFENPERPRGTPMRPDFEGAGAQFRRNLQAGKYPELLEQEEREVVEALPEEEEVEDTLESASTALTGKGQPSTTVWRPTLLAPRRQPEQPDHPPPGHIPKAQGQTSSAARLSYPPPNYPPVQAPPLVPPPLPPPSEPPPREDAPKSPAPAVLPRDRPRKPQHPPGPPRSVHGEQQARDSTAPRKRAPSRGAAQGAPAERQKVLFKERDNSDLRHNRSQASRPAEVTPRPSSLSAVSRATSTPRLVRLEGTPREQQEQSPRQVVLEETNVEEGAASGAPEQVEDSHREAGREEPEEEEKVSSTCKSARVTWALIAPAGGLVTPLAGPKRSRIVSPSSAR